MAVDDFRVKASRMRLEWVLSQRAQISSVLFGSVQLNSIHLVGQVN